MNIIDYFDVPELLSKDKNNISGQIVAFNKDIKFSQYKIILLTVLTNNANITKAEEILKIFYKFSATEIKTKILNVGTLKNGQTFNDTIYALRDLYENIIENKQISIVITDNIFITYGIYLAYELKQKLINISEITSYFLPDNHFLNEIIKRKEKTLLNYVFIGIQKHLTGKKFFDFIEKYKFDYVHLSELQENPLTVEPFIRESNITIFNYNSLINAYLNEYEIFNPNGLTPQDLSLLSAYYGQSEINGVLIINISETQNLNLTIFSQLIWYFIDSLKYRCNDYPILPLKKMEKINIKIGKNNFLTFYRSPKTQRLWLEIPVKKLMKNIIIPCSDKEFIQAKEGILPLKWIKYTDKFK